jgi:glycosyltransferase involved in cell wall biosynthesis
MKIGFHSPLPPAPSGVADYAATLLEALARENEVAVNSKRSAGVELYHLGNNQLHRRIYQQALEVPGVVVLHDAVLQHFFLGALHPGAYVEEFVFNYGEWSRHVAWELWRSRARSAQDARYFHYPMLRRIAEVSRAVVVHNPAAAALVRTHAPCARVIEIPHFFRMPQLPPGHEVIRLRSCWNMPPGALLFSVFGHLRESKRLFSVLRAFETVRGRGVNAALLVAGRFASSDLERAIAPMLASPGIVRVGYMPEREFWLHASAVDVCLNLRHPAAGETSGISIKLMGIGKATIVTASEETSQFPQTACLRVDAGIAETDMLAEYMTWLARFPEAAREIGRRAAAYIAAEHALGKCVRRYREVLVQHDS